MFVCRWRIQSPLRYINPGKYNEIPGACSWVLLDIRGAEKRLGVGVQVGAQSPTAPLFWGNKISKARCKVLHFHSRARHFPQYADISNNMTLKRGLKVRTPLVDRFRRISLGFQLQDRYRVSLTVEDGLYTNNNG